MSQPPHTGVIGLFTLHKLHYGHIFALHSENVAQITGAECINSFGLIDFNKDLECKTCHEGFGGSVMHLSMDFFFLAPMFWL